jgi:tetratricopeptide (TPR) repeat protein
MHRFLKAFIFSSLLFLDGCATVIGAQAPIAETELLIQPTLQSSLHSKLIYQILVAELASKRDQLDITLANYRRAAATTEDYRVAERATILAMFMKEDPVTLELAKRWYALTPIKDQARQALALALIRNRKLDEAVCYLETVRRSAGAKDNQHGYATLASLLTQSDDKQAAMQVMRQFIDRNKCSPFAYYYYGLLAAAFDDADQALASLRLALYHNMKLPFAYQLRARLMLDQGYTEAAVSEMSKAITALPGDRNLRINYARLLINTGQLRKARHQFDILLKRDHKDIEAIYAIGILSAANRHFDMAERYFLALVKYNTRLEDAYFALGRIAEQRGNFIKARIWYEKIRSADRYLNTQIRIGIVSAKTGNAATISRHFETLRRNNPENSLNLYLAESEALRETNHYQEAFDNLGKALSSHPNDQNLLYLRALISEHLNLLDTLERDLLTIIAIDPKNGRALNALGYILANRTNRYQEALNYIQKAVILLPNDATVLDSMGWIQYRLGNYHKSLEYLYKAYRLNKDTEIAGHLSEVLFASGQKDEAKRIWRTVPIKKSDNRNLLEFQEQFYW